MKNTRPHLALRRVLDALEGDLLNAPDAEIHETIAETGFTAAVLLRDVGAALGFGAIANGLPKSAEALDRPEGGALRSRPPPPSR